VGADLHGPKESALTIGGTLHPGAKGTLLMGHVPSINHTMGSIGLGSHCHLRQNVTKTIQQRHHTAAMRPVAILQQDWLAVGFFNRPDALPVTT